VFLDLVETVRTSPDELRPEFLEGGFAVADDQSVVDFSLSSDLEAASEGIEAACLCAAVELFG
jgi:hypothetical protein